MSNDPARFKKLVEESLCRQVAAINHLSDKGLYFWDYGNAFLLEASRAGERNLQYYNVNIHRGIVKFHALIITVLLSILHTHMTA